MKCLCGYEHESGLDDKGNFQENLTGDKKFTLLSDRFHIDDVGFLKEEVRVYLWCCPKCSTVQMSKYNY